MFPERRKAARAKQEMQILQRLLGEQTDEAMSLLRAAMPVARRRVVVKRPGHAATIASARVPDIVIPGRASRYDVYLARP
jgi:16S rRNA (guanine1516-N2)-methyltransferase